MRKRSLFFLAGLATIDPEKVIGDMQASDDFLSSI